MAAPSVAWLLVVGAALAGGFVLGCAAGRWQEADALVGVAMGLLVVLVAAAGFLFGERRSAASQTVRLDPESIAHLAALIAGKRL